MRKSLLSIFITILLLIQLVGCYNYTEINKITFATSVIFHRDEYDNVVIYLDCVTPYRDANESSDKGKRVVYKGSGKTALEAIRDVNIASSNNLNFSQVRAYIFTEEAATKGLDKYIDLIENNQQFNYKTYMFVYFGEVETLISTESNDEEYLGLYLDSLVEMNKKNGKVISKNVSEYLTETVSNPKVSIMSAIELEKDVIDEKILLKGGVIMKDNHMISRLEEKNTLTYNLLKSKIREGSFQIINPKEVDKYITLDILENYNKLDIIVKNNKVMLNCYIRVRTSIGEIQGKLDVNESIVNNIEKNQEEKLKILIEKFFNEYKEDNIDILRVERLVKEKYPKYDVKDILSKTEIIPKVEVIVDGSSLIKSSR